MGRTRTQKIRIKNNLTLNIYFRNMCLLAECKYIELIELETGYKIAVHYGKDKKNRYKIIFIDFWRV